jgi:hypothetical protein
MSLGRKVVLILLIGSLWGMLEVLLWDVWHLKGWSHAAVPLAVVAILCLALGRRVLDKPGTSLAIAAVACLYKFASVAFFVCQMSGVLTLAASFEIFALLTSRYFGRESVMRPYLMGLLSVYPAFVAFAIISTFVTLVPYWAEAGWARILPYLGWPAVVATLGGALASAAGWSIAARLFSAERVVRWKVAIPTAVVMWGLAVVHACGL